MNIRDIPKDGKKLSIKKDSTWFMDMVGDAGIDVDSLREDLTSTIDVHLQGGQSVVIEGDLHTDVVLRCVKCLDLFHTLVNRHFSVTLEPYDVQPSAKHAVSSSELDTEFYVNDEFDPEAVVFEQIMLSLPQYPLCRHDCRGLCPYCGLNLNEQRDHVCRKQQTDNPLNIQLKKIKNKLKRS